MWLVGAIGAVPTWYGMQFGPIQGFLVNLELKKIINKLQRQKFYYTYCGSGMIHSGPDQPESSGIQIDTTEYR
jgi:hypothetical protein